MLDAASYQPPSCETILSASPCPWAAQVICVRSDANLTPRDVKAFTLDARREKDECVRLDQDRAMNRALEAHGLVPLVDSVHPFADTAAGYRRLACGANVGNVLIKLD